MSDTEPTTLASDDLPEGVTAPPKLGDDDAPGIPDTPEPGTVPRGYMELPIQWLVKASWNYKKENEDLSDALRNNLKRNGQIENVVVRHLDTGYFEIVNGNHRYDDMKALAEHSEGFTRVMCFHVGQVSLAEAKRIAVELNETRFESDQVELAELIGEITTEFGDEDVATTLPYTEGELDHFGDLLDFDFGDFDPGDSDPEGQGEGSGPSQGERVELAFTLDTGAADLWDKAARMVEDRESPPLPDDPGERRGILLRVICERYMESQAREVAHTPEQAGE